MTLTDLANIGNLLGGIGVIVSLIYLAVQIRLNTKQVRAATHSARSYQVFQLLTAGDPGYMQIDFRVSSEAADLDPVELRRFYDFQLARFYLTQDDHLLHQSKMIDDEAFAQTTRTMEAILRNAAVRRCWRMAGRFYRPEFRAYMDAMIARIEASDAQAYVHTASLLDEWKAMAAAERASRP